MHIKLYNYYITAVRSSIEEFENDNLGSEFS